MHKNDLSIDRVTRSHQHTFPSVRLDRLAEKRDDAAWLETARQSPNARFVPLWRNLSLLQHSGGEQKAVYLKAGEIEFTSGHPPTLLGADYKRCFFTTPVNLSLIHISEPTRPPLLSRMPSSA